MFTYTEPTHCQRAWVLSQGNKEVLIDKDITVNLRNPDIHVINFLYQNFNNKFKGSILNVENGFSTQLQVSAFLNIIFKQYFNPTETFIVLVITPEYLIPKWKNQLENLGGLKTKIVNSTTSLAGIDKENGLAFILSFESIKLASVLEEYQLFSVVIDHFDLVANKLLIKKICGDFNIGITERNFYTNPDQKLQWKMLNWANPNSVGRLKDYYEADNDNFANLRDNYHHWWLTITWDFCDSFKKNLDHDEDDEFKPLQKVKTKKREYKKRQRKSVGSNSKESLHSCDNVVTSKNSSENTSDRDKTFFNHSPYDSNPNKNLPVNKKKLKMDVVSDTDTSSQDTIEYVPEFTEQYHSKTPEDDNILIGIIEGISAQNNEQELDHETQVHLKKEELYSQIFDDIPFREKQNYSPDSSDEFFKSLI